MNTDPKHCFLFQLVIEQWRKMVCIFIFFQVGTLVAAACSVDNLCRMDPAWHPWLQIPTSRCLSAELALFAAYLLAALLLHVFLSAFFFSSYLMFVNAFFVMCFFMPGMKYDRKDVISGTLMLTSVWYIHYFISYQRQISTETLCYSPIAYSGILRNLLVQKNKSLRSCKYGFCKKFFLICLPHLCICYLYLKS